MAKHKKIDIIGLTMGNIKYSKGFIPFIFLLYGGVALLVGLTGFLGFREYQLKQKTLGTGTVAPTTLPSTPIPTQTPKPIVTKTTTPDPITDCVSSYPNCNGESIRLKQSQCKNITCCQVGSTWSVYPSTEKCKEAQNSVQTTQQTQQTAQYHCYNSTKDYWYYTSKEQCDADNAYWSSHQSCADAVNAKVKACDSACEEDMNTNRSACAWGYTGPNAGIEQNNDKYEECLNEALEKHGSCLDNCTNQQEQGFKACQ
jgi:hypothetical protein